MIRAITKRRVIRSVHEGDALTLVLSQENERAWRQRVHEINKEDGWEHYCVSKNSKLDTLAIIANVKLKNNRL